MNVDDYEKIAGLALCLGHCGGHLSAILQTPTALDELGSRGVQKAELENLVETILKVARVFYTPQTRSAELH